MEMQDIQKYIHIGAIHWYLVSLPLSIKANGEDSAASAIMELKGNIKLAKLPVTLRAGYKLWKLGEEFQSMSDDAILNNSQVQKARRLARDLETTRIAEGSGTFVYIVTEKRIDTEKLIGDSSLLLAEQVWESLPVIAARDFIYACRSIAFDLPTAAAFHLLRCVEGTLRHYYLCVIKRKRLPDRKRMWGSMVHHMRAKKSSKPPSILLDNLDNIRINFRNPTNHPGKEYDLDEAQDLFGLCIDALNRLTKTKHWEKPTDCYGTMQDSSE